MTLTSTTSRVQYNGDGSTTAFAVTFVFWDADDLDVVHTDSSGTETTWTRGTQYTVSGGDGATGTVTVDTSPTDYTPASGEKLTILSALDNTQATSLPLGGSFPSSSVEQQLDKIVRLIQQNAVDIGRSIKLPVSSANSDLAIPDPSASKFLRWNSGATALENADVADQGDIGIPVIVAEGGTGAATAAAARTNLGLAIGTDIPGLAQANTFTKTQTWAKGSDVASANALTLGDGNYFDITGTTSITSIGTKGVGTVIKLHFDGALTLTHHATDLILPSGANITTAAGDEAEFIEYATGDWRCTAYTKASGKSVIESKLAQAVGTSYATYSSHATAIPVDDTIPQNTEGEQILSQAITPTNASSTLEIDVTVPFFTGATQDTVAALFKDSGASALAMAVLRAPPSENHILTFKHRISAGSTSAQTFKVRVGAHTGTIYLNGNASARTYGGIQAATIAIKEILP